MNLAEWEKKSRRLARPQLDELQPAVDHAEGHVEDWERPAAQRLEARVRRVGDVHRVEDRADDK